MVSKKKPNIILITFDDCRADHLGFMGYQKNVSPFLDSLAKEGAYFKKAFATGSGSPQSFVAILTSTYPLDYGGFSFIDRPRVLVSEALKKAGYQTIAVHSAAYMSDYFGYNRGWDTFHYLSHFGSGSTMAGIRKDTLRAKILRKISTARNWFKKNIPFLAPVFTALEKTLLLARKLTLEAANFTPPFFTGDEVNHEVKKLFAGKFTKEPLFLWVHYMDVHEPLALFWRKGNGFMRKLKYHLADIALFLFGDLPRLNKFFKKLYLELYDASLASVDGHIGDIFSYLEAAGIINYESLTIVSSDHGEEFFEKGAFGHEQRPFNANLNVPLIVHSPRRVRPAAYDRPVSLIDVSPTILEFARAEKPKIYKGKNIFDESERDVVAQTVDCDGDLTNLRYLGSTIIYNGYKFIRFNDKEMLFSMDDMGEKNDFCSQRPKIVRFLKSRLKKYEPNS